MLKNNMRMTLLLSALIGLVLASFATVPTVNAAHISHVCQTGNAACAGYIGAISAGEITYVTAEWNQPVVTCQPLLGIRQAINMGIGIANPNPGSTFIVGIHDECAQGSSVPTYVAGVIFGSGKTVFTLTVNPGDEFSVSITLSPSTQILTASITDLTTGQSASAIFTEGAFPTMPTTVSWGAGIDTAIAALAQFSVPIRFSHCSVTVSGQTFTISKIGTLVRYTMVDGAGNTMATTSPLHKHGSSFQVTWVSST
jgi:hypothetical protein